MKVPPSLQIALVAVGLTGVYTMVGQSVPQKEVHPPEVIELPQDMTTDQMVEIGKTIFEGKGLCSTCHKIGGSGPARYPDLQGIALRAASREPPLSAVLYISKSMYEPDAYIVDGFTKGMPPINKPPIGLTDDEIRAVIAYLQTLGGEATITMQTSLDYTAAPAGDVASEADAAPVEVAE